MGGSWSLSGTSPRLGSLVVLVLFAGCSDDGADAFDQSTTEVHIDCDSEVGTLVSLHDGVNAGPYSYQWDMNLSTVCDEIGLRRFRTHDLNGGEIPSPGDIPQLVEDFDGADLSDPDSYDFSLIDPLMAVAASGDYEVFYRLGRSFGYSPLDPTTDPARWADVASHVIQHFNEGWPAGAGHEYGIEYWEIFNEPDMGGFYGGSADDWNEFFGAVYTILNDRHPDVRLGCCGFGGSQWREGFLSYCDQHGIELDFVSWHQYEHDDPAVFSEQGSQWRDAMEAHGQFGESILSEWGMYAGGEYDANNNAQGASFYAAALAALQDASIDQAYRYRIDGRPGPDDLQFGMIESDLTLKTPTLAFKAFEQLLDEAPVGIEATASATDAAILPRVIAGKAGSGDVVIAVVSNWYEVEASYSLNVQNVPWQGETTVYERYVISDTLALDLVETDLRHGGDPAWSAIDLPAHEVHLIRLSRSVD